MADYLSRMSFDNDLAISTGNNAELKLLAIISTIFGGTDIPLLLCHELQETTINDAELQAALQHVTDCWEPKWALVAELRPHSTCGILCLAATITC